MRRIRWLTIRDRERDLPNVELSSDACDLPEISSRLPIALKPRSRSALNSPRARGDHQ
jgi:hypothetical protein